MTKSQIFSWFAICFAVGILAARNFNFPIIYILYTLAALIFVFALGFLTQNNSLALIAVFFIAVCAGSLRLNSSLKPNQFQNLFGSKPELQGYIVEDIDVRPDKQLVTFQPDGFNQRLLLTVRLGASYFYGDKLLVYGKLTEPQADATFDYKTYLQRYNIYGTEYPSKILVLGHNGQNKLKFALLKIKAAFVNRLSKLYQEPQNSLLLGILIGAKKTLPQSVTDNFNATGVSHIIAVSGYNITIIIWSLTFLAAWFGRRTHFWVSLLIVIGFVVITGASASVVRAACMGSLLLVAQALGRQYKMVTALLAAAFIMLVINPQILYADVGFQLSFAATLGIIYFMPPLEKLTGNWSNPLNLKTVLLTTLSAIVATLPLLIYNFGTLSLVAPLVNLLIVPLVPYVMLLGFLSVLPGVGTVVAFVNNFLLLYLLRITQYFAHIPYSNLNMEITTWFFAVLVAAVGLLYYVVRHFAALRPVEEKVKI